MIIFLMVPLQDTFTDLAPHLRDEDYFNPLKFIGKIKDVKNTKRADMISEMMIMNQTRTSGDVGTRGGHTVAPNCANTIYLRICAYMRNIQICALMRIGKKGPMANPNCYHLC